MQLIITAALLAAAAQTASLPPQAHYVAMGSSFASGPGVTKSADTPPNRCARSTDNYARQLARKRNLMLVDVSCNAMTTKALLTASGNTPAQLDALTPDTRLVTVTIGGNDVGYMGGLISASCKHVAAQDAAAAGRCNQSFDPTEQNWADLEKNMDSIVAEVRKRSPRARLIFVDYLNPMPERGACDGLPLDADAAAKSRAIGKRLAEVTARAAKRGGADIVQASKLSAGHTVCSKQPWTTLYGPLRLSGDTIYVPYHPNLAGMTAVADALDHMLGR